MLLPAPASGWVFKRAKYHLDFKNTRWHGGYVYLGSAGAGSARSTGSLLNSSGSGAATGTFFAPDEFGILRTFPQYGLRVVRGVGMFIEANTTNYALWCRDFTNAAWSLTSMSAAKTSVGANLAANSATRLTASGANATALQSITLTSRLLVVSAYVRRVTGTGTVSLTVDGGSTYTDISGSINSSGYTIVQIPTQTLANPQVGVRLGTSGDAIDMDFFQCESHFKPTTPILTTTVAVSRGAEEAFFNTDGSGFNDGLRLLNDINFGTPASVYVEYCGDFNTATPHLIYGDDQAHLFLTGPANGGNVTLSVNGVSLASSNTENIGRGNMNKLLATVDGFGAKIWLNGVLTQATTPKFSSLNSPALTHGGHGNRGAGDYPMNGWFAQSAFWNEAVPDHVGFNLTS